MHKAQHRCAPSLYLWLPTICCAELFTFLWPLFRSFFCFFFLFASVSFRESIARVNSPPSHQLERCTQCLLPASLRFSACSRTIWVYAVIELWQVMTSRDAYTQMLVSFGKLGFVARPRRQRIYVWNLHKFTWFGHVSWYAPIIGGGYKFSDESKSAEWIIFDEAALSPLDVCVCVCALGHDIRVVAFILRSGHFKFRHSSKCVRDFLLLISINGSQKYISWKWETKKIAKGQSSLILSALEALIEITFWRA